MAKDHPTGNSGLYRAFLQLKTPEECYRFLQDVCSYSELSAMEQRYNIAELLADKCIYTEIMDKTGASSAIISRVSRALSADDSVLRALPEALATSTSTLARRSRSTTSRASHSSVPSAKNTTAFLVTPAS